MLRWRLQNRLAMVREARGMTQAELARQVQVARITVARWELDETRPTTEMVERLTAVLRCRPRELFPFD
ncbi:MAG TPA: helix-turn-helix transcriptional regulator [Symbiobacteriaceae bacterium]|nr:helix-turn-helix transcriptional regulator [Symbiobacteriaceae bacterium]